MRKRRLLIFFMIVSLFVWPVDAKEDVIRWVDFDVSCEAMERAVELLNTTEDKTYMIAEKVGYTEPNYFSYVFKKTYGIAPSRYRAGRTGKE